MIIIFTVHATMLILTPTILREQVKNNVSLRILFTLFTCLRVNRRFPYHRSHHLSQVDSYMVIDMVLYGCLNESYSYLLIHSSSSEKSYARPAFYAEHLETTSRAGHE